MTFMAGATLRSCIDYGQMMELNDALIARAIIADSRHHEQSVSATVALANRGLPLDPPNHREPFERAKARADATAALEFLDACQRIITHHHFNGRDHDFDLIIDNPLADWSDHEALKHLKHSDAA
jgi:hypothetical protein